MNFLLAGKNFNSSDFVKQWRFCRKFAMVHPWSQKRVSFSWRMEKIHTWSRQTTITWWLSSGIWENSWYHRPNRVFFLVTSFIQVKRKTFSENLYKIVVKVFRKNLKSLDLMLDQDIVSFMLSSIKPWIA